MKTLIPKRKEKALKIIFEEMKNELITETKTVLNEYFHISSSPMVQLLART